MGQNIAGFQQKLEDVTRLTVAREQRIKETIERGMYGLRKILRDSQTVTDQITELEKEIKGYATKIETIANLSVEKDRVVGLEQQTAGLREDLESTATLTAEREQDIKERTKLIEQSVYVSRSNTGTIPKEVARLSRKVLAFEKE